MSGWQDDAALRSGGAVSQILVWGLFGTGGFIAAYLLISNLMSNGRSSSTAAT